MNRIILIGNLTKNPILSIVGPQKKMVCKFTLAVRNTEESANFFPVSVWGEPGKNCHKYLKKGSKVAVSGRLKVDQYESKGVKMQSIEVVADEVQFLSSVKREESAQNEENQLENTVSEEGTTDAE